jgi:hypothetical protein
MPNDKYTALKHILTMSRSETCDINLHALYNAHVYVHQEHSFSFHTELNFTQHKNNM